MSESENDGGWQYVGECKLKEAGQASVKLKEDGNTSESGNYGGLPYKGE